MEKRELSSYRVLIVEDKHIIEVKAEILLALSPAFRSMELEEQLDYLEKQQEIIFICATSLADAFRILETEKDFDLITLDGDLGKHDPAMQCGGKGLDIAHRLKEEGSPLYFKTIGISNDEVDVERFESIFGRPAFHKTRLFDEESIQIKEEFSRAINEVLQTSVT